MKIKAVLRMVVVKEIDSDDKAFYEELLADGDITGLHESFEPELNGDYTLAFQP